MNKKVRKFSLALFLAISLTFTQGGYAQVADRTLLLSSAKLQEMVRKSYDLKFGREVNFTEEMKKTGIPEDKQTCVKNALAELGLKNYVEMKKSIGMLPVVGKMGLVPQRISCGEGAIVVSVQGVNLDKEGAKYALSGATVIEIRIYPELNICIEMNCTEDPFQSCGCETSQIRWCKDCPSACAPGTCPELSATGEVIHCGCPDIPYYWNCARCPQPPSQTETEGTDDTGGSR